MVGRRRKTCGHPPQTAASDLFAAVISDVGVSDTLRVETTANGPPNVPEYGSVTTQEGFKGLLEMSSYHHVRDGTKAPSSRSMNRSWMAGHSSYGNLEIPLFSRGNDRTVICPTAALP